MEIVLRPWLSAGFDYLLAESPGRADELRGMPPKNALANLPRQAAASAAGPFMQRANGLARSPSPATPAPAESSSSGRAALVLDKPATQRNAPTPVHKALPFEQWSNAWKAMWNRHQMPEHPLVIWTYSGLGSDLSGNPSPERRRVIASIMSGLRHPRGTHAFWPHSLPKEGNCEPVFWSVIDSVAPRAILIFGSDSRDALMLPSTLRPFMQQMIGGRLIIQLHRPENLAADQPLLNSTLAFLVNALRFCSVRQGSAQRQ